MPQPADGRPKALLHLLVVKATEPMRTACGIPLYYTGSDARVVLQPKFVECEACRATVDFENALAVGMENVLLGPAKENK